MEKIRIRALILDYGGVISKSQNIDNVNSFLKILKQDDNDFRNVYISKRKNYDNGQLSDEEYWFSIVQHYDLEKNDSKVTKLIQEDIKSWNQINDSMMQFIKESRRNIHKLAIVSNMTRDTLSFMRKHFEWLELFDELIFSCDIGNNKPERRIYIFCLNRIEVPPQECLFVDDSVENVHGAMESGMKVIHFKSFFQFWQELEKNFCLSH